MKLAHINLDNRADRVVPNSVAQLIANGAEISELRTHALLQKDEWKALDTRVVQIARKRLRVTGDLLAEGLRYNLSDALGTMILEHEMVSDMNAATVNMTGKAHGENDTVDYTLSGLPIPIISKQWELNARRLRASRKKGEGLDVTQVSMAARKVAEEVETMVMKGVDTAGNALKFGTYTVYGIENAPNKTTGSLTAAWTGASARDPKADVLAMIQSLVDVNKYGPYGFYVPRAYQTALGDDYVATTSATISIQQRLMKIEGIKSAKIADFATAGKVSCVELDDETIRIVHGQDPTPVEWKSGDAMTMYHRVMAILVPEIRSDQDGRCGISVYSA